MHRTVRISFETSKEARKVHSPFSDNGFSSPNWSDFELHSVNVKHFHFLQREGGEMCQSHLPPSGRNSQKISLTKVISHCLENLPPAQLAPSTFQPALVFFVFLFPLHSELGLSGKSFLLQKEKAEARTLTLGIKNSSALNLYSHSSRKWKRRDNRSCPVWLKQRLSQQKHF